MADFIVQCVGMSVTQSNQIKFNKQQRAESHLQVAKTLIKTINILLVTRTGGKRSNRDGITQNKLYKI